MTVEDLTKFYVYCLLKATYPKRNILSIETVKVNIDKVLFNEEIKIFIFSIIMKGSDEDEFDYITKVERYMGVHSIEELAEKLSELKKYYPNLNCDFKKELEAYIKINSEIKKLTLQKEELLSNINKRILEVYNALEKIKN